MAEKKKKGDMSFLEHLEELRWLIIRSVFVLVIFAIVAFFFDRIIFTYILLAPKNPKFITNRIMCHLAQVFNRPELCINSKPFQLINTAMSGQFQADIWISFLSGVVLAFPYIVWEIWRFVAPALHSHERSNARGAVFAISFLFLLGVLFGFFIIAPLSIHFLGNYSVNPQIQNYINLNSYFSTIASVTLASGLIFELPVFAYFLAKINIISAAFMRKYRRHSFVAILIVGAIIAPPDVFSWLLVSLPLYMLYEVSIFIVVAVQRRKKGIQKT